jgi:glycosyltransferase involved in cell wall biosynthesis
VTQLRLALFTDSYPPQLNGVALLLDRLVAAVRARGGAVRVFTTTDPAAQPDPDIVRWPSISFWAYPEHRIALPNPWKVRRALRAWEPTVVHAASPFGMGLAGRSAARALGVPFVASYHTNWTAYAGYYGLRGLRLIAWPYLRWFHNGGVRTYCPTHATEREVQEHGIRGTAIWSRGVDTEQFNPRYRSAALRAELGVADGGVLAVCVGRLSAEKGLGVALTGLRAVQERARTPVVCAVAGDGPHAAAYRALAPAGTRFVGRLSGSALSAFYASADLFLFPSTTDTFGNVLLEAMASGVPVVGADVGPTRELLSAGGGVTFPPGDAAAFAAQVTALADDPARRAALAAAALGFARRCTWDRIFDDLVADYARVVAGAAPAPSPALPASLLNPLPPRRLQH